MRYNIRYTITLLLLLLFSISAAAVDAPEYSGEPYSVINDNIPFFAVPYVSEGDVIYEVFEDYSPLDELGRCNAATANICTELMPTDERGDISSVIPTGWHSVKYDFVSGKYLYNRCHLIGYQLAGEDANTLNLITGTRYMNITGMLPFENMIADYVKETNNHVLYRVTPDFKNNELVARGVEMEAMSLEDHGGDICFNVYCYNVQPGVVIDYTDGNSGAYGEFILEQDKNILHKTGCLGYDGKNETNIAIAEGAVWEFVKHGITLCPLCRPE
ncbi:MAG: DNA/RNA non-specific endonuclease [Clostridia bacterium]|nr:DNA/RNA non-specific endonuclease [Clostridia bacterium]